MNELENEKNNRDLIISNMPILHSFYKDQLPYFKTLNIYNPSNNEYSNIQIGLISLYTDLKEYDGCWVNLESHPYKHQQRIHISGSYIFCDIKVHNATYARINTFRCDNIEMEKIGNIFTFLDCTKDNPFFNNPLYSLDIVTDGNKVTYKGLVFSDTFYFKVCCCPKVASGLRLPSRKIMLLSDEEIPIKYENDVLYRELKYKRFVSGLFNRVILLSIFLNGRLPFDYIRMEILKVDENTWQETFDCVKFKN
jgi:hypothetical protein